MNNTKEIISSVIIPVNVAMMPEGVAQNAKISKLLNNLFVGKCKANSFIKKIINFRLMNEITFSYATGPNGSVDIRFLAEVSEYSKGSILVNCEVLSEAVQGVLQLKKDDALIVLTGSDNIISQMDRMNIIVETVTYPIGKNYVWIVGRPYFSPADRESSVFWYKVSGDIEEHEKTKLNEIKKEINLLDRSEEEAWEFYSDMNYPFDKPVRTKEFKAQGIKIGKIDSIKGFDGYVCRPTEIDYSTDEVYMTTAVPSPAQNRRGIVEETKFMIMFKYYKSLRDQLKVIGEMKDNYGQDNEGSIWKVYDLKKTRG